MTTQVTVGSPVIASFQFVSINPITLVQSLADPTSVVITVTDPTGAVTTPAVVHDGVGLYHATITPLVVGTWTVSATGSGAVVSVSPPAVFLVAGTPLTASNVVITVTDGTNPVSGIPVTVWGESDSIAATGETGVTGTCAIQLIPGTYTVDASKSRWSFPRCTNLVVTSSPGTLTIAGTNLAISTYGTVRTVRLFGFMVEPNGSPHVDGRVSVRTVGYGNQRAYVPGASTTSGIDPQNVAVAATVRELRTDATGYWECDVVPETIVAVDVQELRIRKVFRVPNDPRITTMNFRDARPDSGPGEMGVTQDTGGYNRDLTL